MNRKKEFIATTGHEGMLIDCGEYEVEIFKNIDMERYQNRIVFIDKKTKNCVPVTAAFIIDWDKESDGGKLSITYRDRWGSEMIFIHYYPSDLKGMFNFIGKGYDVFKSLYKTES